MLNDLYPVQFVEGFNESEETYVDDDYILPVRDYAKAAIEIKPTISAVISRIDIDILTTTSTQEVPTKCAINSDYKNNPSNIELNNIDTTFKPKAQWERSEHYWQQIIVLPVRLVAGRIYWFVIDVNHAQWAFMLAKDGQSTNLRVANTMRWRPETTRKCACMLRLFGRVL